MESRYQDEVVRGLHPVDRLVQVSRWVGAETSLAVWGGGNTSVKLDEPDLLGRPVKVLRVKGSGSDLKSVTRRDFPGVRLPEVLALLAREDMGDQEMVDYLARCLQEPGSPRPSSMTLDGFRSRWTTPRRCASCSASASVPARATARGGGFSLPRPFRRRARRRAA